MSPHEAHIKAFAVRCFAGARGSHHWDHTERVHRLCMHIGAVEGGDLEVIEIAAFLHDVGRPYQDESKGAVCHAEKGAEMASVFLQDYPLSPERRENIVHCIRAHRFRGRHVPRTIEAKILFDADKLDAIGAVGVGRAFLFAGELGARLHNPRIRLEETEPYTEEDTGYREFRLKLCRIKDRMLTAEGHRLAEARHEFMERFFERFLNECDGKL